MTTPLEQYTAYLNRMKELYAKSARTPAEEAEATSIQQKMSPLYTQILAADSKSLEATLTADASDHDLTITINGMDIGFTGQSNTSSRLYTTQHFMKDLVIPELRKLFVLKEGENTIKVTYHKAVPNGFPLELTLATKDADLLHIKASGKTDGVIEKTFTISRTSTGAPTIEVVE